MNYCSHCGSDRLRQQVPNADTHKRLICDQCQQIHYHNPTIICGCIVERDDEIALCLRAIEPQKNTWTIPSGFMEVGESTAAAAQRETLEETGMNVNIIDLYSVFNVLHMHQVYIIYRAAFIAQPLPIGPESSAVEWFKTDTVPWQQLAYPAIETMLKRHCSESASGHFNLYLGDADAGRTTPIGNA